MSKNKKGLQVNEIVIENRDFADQLSLEECKIAY